MTEGECSCQPVREFPDRLDRLAVDELAMKRANADWPDGIGEEPVFGEVG